MVYRLLLVLIAICVGRAAVVAADPTVADRATSRAEIFGTKQVHEFHLIVTARITLPWIHHPLPDLPLSSFVNQRVASVRSQLEGKTKGYIPTQGIGFGGPPGPGQQLAKPLMDTLDADKDGQISETELTTGLQRLSRNWDQDRNGGLSQKEIADGLQKLLPARPRGPGGF